MVEVETFMDMKKSKKLLVYMAVIYWAMVLVIYVVAYPQFKYSIVDGDVMSANMIIGEIVDGMDIRQQLVVPAQELQEISLMTATYERENNGTMILTLCDTEGTIVSQKREDISTLKDGQYNVITLDSPVADYKGEVLELSIMTEGCMPGNAITLYAGNSIRTGRFDVAQSIPQECLYRVGEFVGAGSLCVKLSGVDRLDFYRTYWIIVLALFVLASVFSIRWWRCAKQGKNNPLVAVCTLYTRYSFLLKQLVGRDFKTKYKRSVLGMAWSFLNPLLTMCVQYVVFSTLFKSDIPNYAVYLLTGIVFMNFFSEAVSMGMTSITGNASLIKKVYVPKYIYPISRVISSLVNFVIALIPLMLVMIFTGLMPRPALILLVFDILCLLGFITGMGLLLTTAMTFFQDTQFLWGVISMMWMYLTPIFYPESIIAEQFLTVYRMNPMYQYITFARTCIIDGVSPAPLSYLWCLLSSVMVLWLGIIVFKKHQDRFVLYL